MKTALLRLLAAGLLSLPAATLHAQTSMVPSAMNYQGLLTDTNGDPVAPSAPENRNVEFRIYSQASGGTPLWGEAQTVTVFKGHFSVVLGNGTAVGGAPSGPASFASVFANATTADLYFGITPQGGPEFAPRQKLLASAYALRARTAEQVNQTTGDSQFNWLYANNLTMRGHTKIEGGNILEFGVNDPSRPRTPGHAAGQIGYQAYSSGLDIVGAGAENNQRRITMYAEAGTDFKGPISFSGRYGQAISFNDAFNGVGVQNEGVYLRGFARIAFFANGAHHDGVLNPGTNGTLLGHLSTSGFTLNSGVFTGNGSGLTNINPNSLPNNYNYLGINGAGYIEFGRGVPKLGGSGLIQYADNILHIVGGGNAGDLSDRRIHLHAQGGVTVHGGALLAGNLRTNGHTEAFGPIYAKSNVVIEGTGKLNFDTPSRTGQHINLWGTEYGIGINNSNLYQRSASAFKWYVGGAHDDNGSGGGVEIASWTSGNIDFWQRVYIGGPQSSGGFPPLEIAKPTSAGVAYGGGGAAHFYKAGNGTGYDTNAFSAAVSVKAGNAVLASEFIATSDLRLKLPEGRSDAARDLEMLGALEVTDYTMKDEIADGPRKHKKLIAQQVEKVYPHAVSRSKGVVPDIFRMATAKDGFIKFKEAGEVDLKTGDTVRLIGTKEVKTEVTEVNEEGFKVKDAVEEGDLFVYGREVDDLRLVDYEGIAMLNVSATQELTRQLKAQIAELARVKSERDALAKEVAALRTATTRQDQRLAAIEARLEAADRPSARPVALQAKSRAK